jgi:hypothetical protein
MQSANKTAITDLLNCPADLISSELRSEFGLDISPQKAQKFLDNVKAKAPPQVPVVAPQVPLKEPPVNHVVHDTSVNSLVSALTAGTVLNDSSTSAQEDNENREADSEVQEENNTIMVGKFGQLCVCHSRGVSSWLNFLLHNVPPNRFTCWLWRKSW